MRSAKKIAVITGTRAEYGILKPLLERIRSTRGLQLQLYVTGVHLLPAFGNTIDDIRRDGFMITKIVPMYKGTIRKSNYYAAAVAEGIKNFSSIFSTLNAPDIVIVLGDRPEPLAAALAAAFLNIPIVHVQGGDRTESNDIDESIRHAITRFAHIHCVATKKSAQRIIKSGEEAWRIYEVGSLGVESILAEPRLSQTKLFKKYHLKNNEPFFICLHHPIHLQPQHAQKEMRVILKALSDSKIPTIIIFPNNDAGYEGIIAEIDRYRHVPHFQFFRSLPHQEYSNLLKHCAALIGNSSSGIIETPSLKVPYIHVGNRQKLRERSNNTIDVSPHVSSIAKAIEKVLTNKAFQKQVARSHNPYGTGKTSKKIVRLLSTIMFDDKLLGKKITY